MVREHVTGMSGPDEIARAFQAATNIPRSQLYGTEHDRQMPNSLAESAQTPYVGFVGRNYREGGTVLIAVNPGGGGDTQERTPGDAALEMAILTLRDAPLASLQRCLDAVTDAYVTQLEIIRIGTNVVSPVLEALKSTLAEVAFLNLFPYRTRKNATPLAPALQRALDDAIGPLVTALAPSRIIFLGKKAGDMTGDRFAVQKSYTIQRTNGDRYLCAEAIRVLNEIKTDRERVGFERESWRARDWFPAVLSFLSRRLFLPLLRLRDWARTRSFGVQCFVALVFYPSYVVAMVLWSLVAAALLFALPVVLLIGWATRDGRAA